MLNWMAASFRGPGATAGLLPETRMNMPRCEHREPEGEKARLNDCVVDRTVVLRGIG